MRLSRDHSQLQHHTIVPNSLLSPNFSLLRCDRIPARLGRPPRSKRRSFFSAQMLRISARLNNLSSMAIQPVTNPDQNIALVSARRLALTLQKLLQSTAQSCGAKKIISHSPSIEPQSTVDYSTPFSHIYIHQGKKHFGKRTLPNVPASNRLRTSSSVINVPSCYTPCQKK